MSNSSKKDSSICESKIVEFIEDLASSSPAPGGGAAAALSGALGISLTSMVYNLTVGKKAYENLSDELKDNLNNNLKECKRLYLKMLEYIEMDKVAFLALMDSYKLPKVTEEEKIVRKNVIKQRTLDAMNIPFKLAKAGIEFYKNIEFAIKYGNENLISDAAISAIMLNACIESSIINVEINLAQIDDEAKVTEVRHQIQQLRFINETLKRNILENTDKKINKR